MLVDLHRRYPIVIFFVNVLPYLSVRVEVSSAIMEFIGRIRWSGPIGPRQLETQPDMTEVLQKADVRVLGEIRHRQLRKTKGVPYFPVGRDSQRRKCETMVSSKNPFCTARVHMNI